MSYQEKRTLVSMVSGLLILAAYCFYAIGQYNSGALTPDNLGIWARMMLVFIGIGVVVSIIIQIVFHIFFSVTIAVTEKIKDQDCDDQLIEKSIASEMVEDEMGKLIELKSKQVGLVVPGIGFVAGLISLVLNAPPVVMLNILFISFSIGSLLEGGTQLYFYRRGVSHA